MDDTTLAALIAVGSVLGFALFWMAMGVLISLFGWRWLARHYRTWKAFPATFANGQSGGVGIGNYNQVLRVAADGEGLWLGVSPLFRAGHPPLFIPWEDVASVARADILFFYRVKLRFRRSSTTVQLRGRKLGEYLWAASGGRFALEPERPVARDAASRPPQFPLWPFVVAVAAAFVALGVVVLLVFAGLLAD